MTIQKLNKLLSFILVFVAILVCFTFLEAQPRQPGADFLRSETGEVLLETRAAKDIVFATNTGSSAGKRWAIDGTTGNLKQVGNTGIFASTADASDSATTRIGGGGSGSTSRGSFCEWYGNEVSGSMFCYSGTTGANSDIAFRLGNSTSGVAVDIQNSAAQNMWSFDGNGGQVIQGAGGTSIVLQNASSSVAQPAVGSVSAAGTTIADATDLTTVFTEVTTVGASQGVQLWDAIVGSNLCLRNGGANTLTVYPHGASAIINGGSAGAGVSCIPTELCCFMRITAGAAGRWIGFAGVTF